jgi:hypothetical protein
MVSNEIMPEQIMRAMRPPNSPRIVGRALVLAVGLLTLAACNPSKPLRPAPPTYPVSGEVTLDRGQLPAGAQVEFRPESAEKANDFTARGRIDPAGKFSLNTPFIDRVLPGAIEGPHTVRILFPTNASSNNGYSSGLIPVSEKFTVKPTENHFTITIPKP